MKKNILGMLLIALLLSACASDGGGNNKAADAEPTETATEKTESAAGVSKGLLNVEVTIPAEFFEEDELIDIAAQAEEEDGKVTTINDDGSVTYKMTKAQHKEMMKEMKVNLEEYVDELIVDDDFASIHDVTYNKNFSKFTMTVDQEAFENSFDGFAVLGVGMGGMFYQLYDGVNADKMNVAIDTVDESTGEVIGTVNYPEDLEGME